MKPTAGLALLGTSAMTSRRPCPPAPGLLEDYAARFDDLFFSLAQGAAGAEQDDHLLGRGAVGGGCGRGCQGWVMPAGMVYPTAVPLIQPSASNSWTPPAQT